jgi:type VI secretion system secreted protein VgrG
LLSRASNSRIFQQKTVPNIVAKIFEEHGFSGEVDDSGLEAGNYGKHDFLVQYHETDFNFVSRLMEQAGIYYSFRHGKDNHVLVLSDGPTDERVPGYETIRFVKGESGQGALGEEHIDSLSVGLQVEPSVFVAKEFDFEKPRAPLLSRKSAPLAGSDAKLEVFEYPGHYIDGGERNAYVGRRLEEQQLDYEAIEGTANARGIRPGARFKLSEYPWAAQNREYLVTSASYTLAVNDYTTGGGSAEADFSCHFVAIDGKRSYRTPMATPKPTVSGPQTAIVVGKAGEEIWTDKYGRVKVHFHWDREGKEDETSSCWVRVAQIWAGAKWGAMHIPRIGQEVIVDFLEGDPDRPIITGRVYNGDNMPPYDLPANQTQSGLKSHSTKGGGPKNFNELRFEDKKGSEQVFLQAEKDLESLVKNNEQRTVGANRSTDIGNDESITVGGNRTEQVAKNETIAIGASRTETVAANESVTVGAARSLTVALADANTIGGAHDLTVGGNDTTSVGGSQSVTVGGGQNTSVGAGSVLDVGKDLTINVGAKRSISIAGDDTLEIGKKLSIRVADEISITTGDATISLKKNGDITIKGKNITLDGSGKINVKAGSDLVLKGTKIGQN